MLGLAGLMFSLLAPSLRPVWFTLGLSLAVSSGVFYGNGAEAVCFRPILVRSALRNPILCAWLQIMLLACVLLCGSV